MFLPPTPASRARQCGWRFLSVLTLMLLAAPVFANPVAPAPLPDTGASVLRVIGAMLLVMAIFFGGVWLFKNWQRLMAKQLGRSQRLNVLEARPLGNRQALYVIGYDRQRMLVASSPAGMTLLTTLPDAPEDEPSEPVATVFGDVLQKALGQKS